jgi:hypothetical protein
MANDAFALSPISARASLPSEEDYEAIREAFMETSRGRWFLTEYARRNRNADTSMVLDAVARIEDALAAQAQPPPPPPPVEDKRAQLLAAISSAVAQAEETAASALNNLGVEDGLAPIRKGARIIKEISWRWREIGADGRICDLIDSQLSAIDAGCNQIADIDPRTALRAAFEIIKTSIEGFSDAAAPGAAKVDDVVAEASPATDEVAAATAEEINATGEGDRAEVALATPEEPTDAAVAKPAELAGANDAYDEADEAILDIVAAEMSAPEKDEVADAVAKPRAHVTEPPLIEPFVVASEPEPKAMPETWPRPRPLPVVAPVPPAEPSLGATILASGILPRQKPLASDPLAPIRRMSQAEKIALFS